jgi:(4S)-4-hydroxy-5-phosphonooxypentane-2,3-dione isomerase
MPKFANVVTIEVVPRRRDQVVTELAAHRARLKDEPGTLQFEVLLPQDDDTKIFAFEMYRDAAAFEVHSERAIPCTIARRDCWNGDET